MQGKYLTRLFDISRDTSVCAKRKAIPTNKSWRFGSAVVRTLLLSLVSRLIGDSQDIRNHFHRDGAVPALVDLVAAGRREKSSD
jgi:hypothetical protein